MATFTLPPGFKPKVPENMELIDHGDGTGHVECKDRLTPEEARAIIREAFGIPSLPDVDVTDR